MGSGNWTEVVEPAAAAQCVAFVRVCQVAWLLGIGVSSALLLAQLAYFALVPTCRKHDEHILTVLSAVRIVNTICEYLCIHVVTNNNTDFTNVVFFVYFQTDFALVCWMFVFSKNVYDKVVLVFTVRRCSVVVKAVLIFLISLPPGLLCIFLRGSSTHFLWFYHTYAVIKFVLVIINAVIFVKILAVAYKRGSNSNRNVTDLAKAVTYSFILVCVTSLQVFVVDVMSVFVGKNECLESASCVLNAFQVVLITVIFLTLARNKQRQAALASNGTITIRFNRDST